MPLILLRILISLSRPLLSAICAATLLSAISYPVHAATHVKKKKTPIVTEQKKQDAAHFNERQDVQDFIAQMSVKHGFDSSKLSLLFEQVRYTESARQLIKPAPPGRPKNWKAYRARFVEPYRIDAGLAFWDKYATTLARAEQTYGVPAEIIVGLIGVETIFGKNTGNYRVMDALTTLAFDYPETPTRVARMDFFKTELENMLLMARESKVDPFAFKGSYAGAIGWPQFMPSSIRQYAVDFDGDGVINLTDSAIDAIGSVANYLAVHGWKKNLPIAFPATLVATNDQLATLNTALGQGLHATYSLQDISALASTANSEAPNNILYGLADLQNGNDPTEYWLVTDNFFAITYYNRSYFYAMSVVDLGRTISAARGK
ncbi:lytic murein transglycosylase B [Undibacterium sp. SXout7W]|uniref:lytic murein transglycosylase B n=1 Tax=Undibacterium sp. SXout7W TaxID=3413049 RepID=UPI003BF09666